METIECSMRVSCLPADRHEALRTYGITAYDSMMAMANALSAALQSDTDSDTPSTTSLWDRSIHELNRLREFDGLAGPVVLNDKGERQMRYYTLLNLQPRASGARGGRRQSSWVMQVCVDRW